ncbi:endonuclease domain-containing protein [Francisella tularensis]|uniref:DUF559 domain-containing protein n=3 Tax=Francisella tularensis TaxID=263 RepID=Q5NHD7_FRATT|nr:DUF559 domain-containing protein [Francisella tularensis]ADA78212.1 hypothetical protein NE061598_02960 [Francisella tularensis subsp. tularensis NE061598]AFB78672.1 DNA methylase putative [Francisella tularensis subsp. tularensis TIGB03]AFB80217.1 DNA methylase putative [Francisella tularensis subsp. tularensis TI0902]AJI69746.1 hypothetical protein BZ14_311 [Francisella tularensis subsp. tularensis SCHU S4]AJI71246.1 hypothetical protein CH69_333 [Francisella tularensis subsp. tularensis]
MKRILPYNPKLKDRAKELRKAGILSEILLWQELKSRKFLNLDFDRQKVIGNYIVDFYCDDLRLVIEIDGSSHDDKQEYDSIRDLYLLGLDLKVLHIQDIDVKKNLDGMIRYLVDYCEKLGANNTPPSA